MFSTSQHIITAAIAAIALCAVPSAYASDDDKHLRTYADMCVKAADFPKPLGESDLKGHPKLAAYCSCFAKPFYARAVKAAEEMSADPDKYFKQTAKKSEIAKTEAEELGFRNACRKQLGLPLASSAGAADTARAGHPAVPGPMRK